jgi:hypothetical protein
MNRQSTRHARPQKFTKSPAVFITLLLWGTQWAPHSRVTGL